MKRSKQAEELIAFALKQNEVGTSVTHDVRQSKELCGRRDVP